MLDKVRGPIKSEGTTYAVKLTPKGPIQAYGASIVRCEALYLNLYISFACHTYI
jgi:hypothetical protein